VDVLRRFQLVPGIITYPRQIGERICSVTCSSRSLEAQQFCKDNYSWPAICRRC